MNNLGVILEENNNNNCDLEKSYENHIFSDEDNQYLSFQNYSIDFENISFLKESNSNNEFKYRTQQLFFNKKQFNDIINGKTEGNKQRMNKKENQNQKKINKCNSEDVIILNSRKMKLKEKKTIPNILILI